MKQKDLALILVIVFISAIVSYVVSNALIASPKNRKQKAEVVQKITSSFTPPDKKYFNKEAFNPTKIIQVGDNNNPDPFKGGQAR